MTGNYPRQEVMQELERRIVSGQWNPGQRLPTEELLSGEFRVSRGTVRNAIASLVENGLIERRHGVGSFVCRDVTLPGAPRRVVVFGAGSGNLTGEILYGIQQRAATLRCEVELGVMPRSIGEASAMLSSLRRMNLAGVVLAPFICRNYHEVNSRILDLLEEQSLRYVVVDAPVASHGVIRGNFVGNDGYSAMRKLVKALFELGHRRIASIRGFNGVYSSDQRHLGIVDQLEQEGAPVLPELHRELEDVPLLLQGRKRIHELMALAEPPTALVCTHDMIALNVYDELRRMRIEVPDDISLCGFDNAIYTEPLGLSTVSQPYAEIGARAVEILLDNAVTRRQEFLPCELILRSSIRKLQGEI